MAGFSDTGAIKLMPEPEAAASALLSETNPSGLKVRCYKLPTYRIPYCVDRVRCVMHSLSPIVGVAPWYSSLSFPPINSTHLI